MRITFDTAILVRTNAKARGQLRNSSIQSGIAKPSWFSRHFFMEEVERGLKYPRMQALYKLAESEIRAHVEYLESFAEMVTPPKGRRLCSKSRMMIP